MTAEKPLAELAGSSWEGQGELWLDPLGDEAQRYACSLRVEAGAVRYTWKYEDTLQEATLSLADGGGATWHDSWHQKEPTSCTPVAGDPSLLALYTTYGAGEGPPWGWFIRLVLRPSGQLVLQMTNVTSWGEQVRAVRMIFERA